MGRDGIGAWGVGRGPLGWRTSRKSGPRTWRNRLAASRPNILQSIWRMARSSLARIEKGTVGLRRDEEYPPTAASSRQKEDCRGNGRNFVAVAAAKGILWFKFRIDQSETSRTPTYRRQTGSGRLPRCEERPSLQEPRRSRWPPSRPRAIDPSGLVAVPGISNRVPTSARGNPAPPFPGASRYTLAGPA